LWYLLDGSLEVLLASVGLATNIMQDFLPLSYFFLLLHWGQLIFQSARDFCCCSVISIFLLYIKRQGKILYRMREWRNWQTRKT
ncbi:hypothetical protein, partial [Cloacibacillus evryensis]|uniref:hypothetical protein n=1 Tax=Cloacibacillus evryensis TaxID=508460 RepID=UPI002B1F1FFF